MSCTAVYLRVSTLDQDKGIRSQETALKDYLKAHRIRNVKWYRDKVSGATTNRPAFKRLQKDIFAGKIDTVICWKLDRLSRSMRDGVEILTDWCDKGIRVIAVAQQIDFNGTVGKIIAAVLMGVAQMERENLRENTKRGLAAARERGVKLGRPDKIDLAQVKKLRGKGVAVSEIAQRLGCSRQGIYEAMKRNG